jgi:hypothetical protein
MSSLIYRIRALLSQVLQDVPLGTNLALFTLLWMLMSGRLLQSRGAVIPGLADLGLSEDAIRRAWAALAYGRWTLQPLLARWQALVHAEGRWQPHVYGGFRPVACDLVGFFRPRLQHCPTKHYSSAAGKALPALPFGVVVAVGSVGSQRVPLPRAVLRAAPEEPRETALQQRLLETVARTLAPEEALVSDRGFPLAEVLEAGVTRFVLRVPQNFTARRAAQPAYSGRGRPPTYGERVRPLPRRYRGHLLAATPPDRVEEWEVAGQTVRAEFWDELVLSEALPGTPRFGCVVIHDPRFLHPLALAVSLALPGPALQAFYADRWPVEQLPLAAKQVVGAHRQFVFASESRQRLPELAFLAGSILTYVAATTPAVRTGFWDRAAQPTCGRLRRLLARVNFSDWEGLPGHFRKKAAVTDHLPKGILGHRRQPASPVPKRETPQALSLA